MYVCNCNGFTDAEAKKAIESGGAKTVACVHRHCSGDKPQCGKCSNTIRDLLSKEDRVS